MTLITFIRYYEESEGIWKLELSSDEIVQTVTSQLDFGGRNIIRNSINLIFDDYYFIGILVSYVDLK